MNAMRHAPQHAPKVWAEAVRRASGHTGRWPTLSVWHGDADNTVHISNADALLGQWAELHGLPAEPSQTEELHGHQRSWQHADGTVPLKSYTIAGAGQRHTDSCRNGQACQHGPDQCRPWGPYFIEAGLASTFEIGKFWGLKRPAPHIVKQVAAKQNPVRVPALGMAEPAAKPTVDAMAPPPEFAEPKSLRAIIVKALKTAGLVKD